jgi:hypothetical protein
MVMHLHDAFDILRSDDGGPARLLLSDDAAQVDDTVANDYAQTEGGLRRSYLETLRHRSLRQCCLTDCILPRPSPVVAALRARSWYPRFDAIV